METTLIRERLERLRRVDADRKVFGAIGHEYELNPVLDQQGVIALEERHGVDLPSEYRAFLTEVGNGGAGPFYGCGSPI